eukprot:GHVT01030547.1.p3 GENE.GHVT01030547.1~~GHVT01030547.1.p3  ORF type:complete len:115 (-),score=24.71 GHVT01030547.1:947-1291(-)
MKSPGFLRTAIYTREEHDGRRGAGGAGASPDGASPEPSVEVLTLEEWSDPLAAYENLKSSEGRLLLGEASRAGWRGALLPVVMAVDHAILGRIFDRPWIPRAGTAATSPTPRQC